ncbi:MAG TPA: SDR family oxidoreductase [Euzebyales bacterium]|nr:SDR family oxidoreductase [Euzebyales bacterium]
MRRIAIITGGASGIGAAIGRALVVRGHDVVLADVQHDAAERLAEQLTAAGPGAARGVLLDVRDGDQVADLVRDVHAAHERLDLMFNNAGVDVSGEPEELSLAHWERAIDVNLRGVLHGCRAAYPLMKEQPQGGYIVNTASLAGLMPISGGTAPYAMTKSGVVGLSLALRAAGADFGVRVSVVCPGFVDTPILDTKGPSDLPVPTSAARLPTMREMLRRQRTRLYPADRLAADVLRGIARNRAVIVSPRSVQALWWMWRLAPPLGLKLAVDLTRQARRTIEETPTVA